MFVFFFWHKKGYAYSLCSKRYAYSKTEQHEKHAFQDLKVTRLLLDGVVWTESK